MLIVVNPVAGGNDKDSFIDSLRSSFPTVKVLRTRGDDKDEERVRERSEGHDVVVAVGGDGTVRLVVSAIIGTKKALGVVPAGSANGFAGELGITVRNALDVLSHGVVGRIDTLRVNDLLCVHMADIGFNAALMKRFGKRSVRGLLGYALEGLRQLFIGSSFSLVLGKKRFSRVSQVSFANGRQYGSGIVINPDGSLDDGRFEVVLASFFSHRHTISVERAVVRNVAKKPVQVDGEYIGRPKDIDVSLVKRDLRVVMPKS